MGLGGQQHKISYLSTFSAYSPRHIPGQRGPRKPPRPAIPAPSGIIDRAWPQVSIPPPTKNKLLDIYMHSSPPSSTPCPQAKRRHIHKRPVHQR